jgi:phospholipase C
MAAELSPVLSLESPRDPDTWPDVMPQPVPPYAGVVPAPGAALRGLGKSIFHAFIALAESRGKPVPALVQDENLTRADGIAMLDDLAADVFVRLRGS